jgi:hypothetical protein
MAQLNTINLKIELCRIALFLVFRFNIAYWLINSIMFDVFSLVLTKDKIKNSNAVYLSVFTSD